MMSIDRAATAATSLAQPRQAAAASAVTTSPVLAREQTTFHTQILRLALGELDSTAYWERVDLRVPLAERAMLAFEQRWFGNKSMARIRVLLTNFAARYDAFGDQPGDALAVLAQWHNIDATSRKLICHWHLQLADPLYRRFTDQFAASRRGYARPEFDRFAVIRWLHESFDTRWAAATELQFASKLMSAAAQAGLLSDDRETKVFQLPHVPAVAVAYLMYLLRTVTFEGTLTNNAFLRSVGLVEGVVESHLRQAPGLGFARMENLVEFEWHAASLRDWAARFLPASKQP